MNKQDSWARFWQGGSVTSFGDRFSKGYQGELRELWMNFFSSLPDGAVVADLGAGNGALEEIAMAYCNEQQRQFTIHAIDLAKSLPSRFSSKSGDVHCEIVWHTGTANEQTGLGERDCDAVIGNFAFEYGDAARTVAEIKRILKPGGKARFVTHHATSSLIRNARDEIAVLDSLLGKNGFLDQVREYLRAFGNIRKPAQFNKVKASGEAEPYRLNMNAAFSRAQAIGGSENATLLLKEVASWTGELVTPPMLFEAKSTLLQRLKDVRHELAANRVRLCDMADAGMDERRLETVSALFVERDMAVVATAFQVPQDPAPIGWLLDATST